MFIGLRLAKAGYFGGDPVSVLNAPVDVIQSALEYEAFEREYESEFMELNRKEST